MTVRQDQTIRQGATWTWSYTWRDGSGDPIDLTGYTARMSIKSKVSAGLMAYLSSGSDAVNGTITLGGAAGTVAVAMTAAETSLLTAGRAVYDLELVSAGGSVTRLLEGRAVVLAEVTT